MADFCWSFTTHHIVSFLFPCQEFHSFLRQACYSENMVVSPDCIPQTSCLLFLLDSSLRQIVVKSVTIVKLENFSQTKYRLLGSLFHFEKLL